MAGSKTAYLSRKLIDHVLGGAPYEPPATVWLVMSTAPFSSSATGDNCAEIAASGYARLELANTAGTWSPATSAIPSEKHNLADLTYPAATSAWGTPASVYLADAASGGNLLYGSDITNAQPVNIGDPARIPATAFLFLED